MTPLTGLNGDASLCAALCTVGGVGELHQRRSTIFWNLLAVQTTTPSGLGTNENGW